MSASSTPANALAGDQTTNNNETPTLKVKRRASTRKMAAVEAANASNDPTADTQESAPALKVNTQSSKRQKILDEANDPNKMDEDDIEAITAHG